MLKDLKRNNKKIVIILLVISFVFLCLSIPFANGYAYFAGNLVRVIMIWTAVLGCVAFLVWHFIFKKKKNLFLLIFAIIFFFSVIMEFSVKVLKGYVISTINITENDIKSDNAKLNLDEKLDELVDSLTEEELMNLVNNIDSDKTDLFLDEKVDGLIDSLTDEERAEIQKAIFKL